MKKFYAIGVFAIAFSGSLFAQAFTTTVTAPNVTATGVIRGGTNTTQNNTSLAADFKGSVGITGVLTTSGDVSIVGGHKLTATGSTELGAPGNSTTLVVNGKSTTVNTVTTDINSANTNTKSITAAGNVAATGVVTGRLGLSAGNGGFTVSNTGETTATSVTAGNIATTGGKVNINGSNGNILTQGVFNAGGKATMDAATGNITSLGQTDTNKLIVRNSAQITNGGLDMTNGKITRVANGTAATDAVNKGQLDTATAQVQTNLDATNGRVRTVEHNVGNISRSNDGTATHVQNTLNVGGAVNADSGTVQTGARRVSSEGVVSYDSTAIANGSDVQAAVSGLTMSLSKESADRAEAINAATAKLRGEITAAGGSANSHTDLEVAKANARADAGDQRTLQASKDYTDQKVGELRQEVNAVGAMAMAAAVVGNVSPEPGKNTAVTVAVGHYRGASAGAVGVTHRLNERTRFFGALSKSGKGGTGVSVGTAFSF